jgi:hypothetical protein
MENALIAFQAAQELARISQTPEARELAEFARQSFSERFPESSLTRILRQRRDDSAPAMDNSSNVAARAVQRISRWIKGRQATSSSKTLFRSKRKRRRRRLKGRSITINSIMNFFCPIMRVRTCESNAGVVRTTINGASGYQIVWCGGLDYMSTTRFNALYTHGVGSANLKIAAMDNTFNYVGQTFTTAAERMKNMIMYKCVHINYWVNSSNHDLCIIRYVFDCKKSTSYTPQALWTMEKSEEVFNSGIDVTNLPGTNVSTAHNITEVNQRPQKWHKKLWEYWRLFSLKKYTIPVGGALTDKYSVPKRKWNGTQWCCNLNTQTETDMQRVDADSTYFPGSRIAMYIVYSTDMVGDVSANTAFAHGSAACITRSEQMYIFRVLPTNRLGFMAGPTEPHIATANERLINPQTEAVNPTATFVN